MSTFSRRIDWIDQWRGLAALLMLVYHIAFDMHYLGVATVDFASPFWWLMGNFIRVSFLLLVGVSLYLSSRRGNVFFARQIKRALAVWLVAMGVSAVTYLFFGEQWIRFGILHLIAVGILLGAVTVRRPVFSLLLAIGFLIGGAYFTNLQASDYSLLVLGAYPEGFKTLDYFPLFPWAGFVLIGISFGYLFDYLNLYQRQFPATSKTLRVLGRHALLFYIIHQPIVFGGLWLLTKVN